MQETVVQWCVIVSILYTMFCCKCTRASTLLLVCGWCQRIFNPVMSERFVHVWQRIGGAAALCARWWECALRHYCLLDYTKRIQLCLSLSLASTQSHIPRRVPPPFRPHDPCVLLCAVFHLYHRSVCVIRMQYATLCLSVCPSVVP